MRNVDLNTVRCGWPQEPGLSRLLRTNARTVVASCSFKASHLIGTVPICNTHFRMMRRYVEKTALKAVTSNAE